MRRHRLVTFLALLLLAGFADAAPWTYRGSLNDGGQPANGRYDIRLTLLDESGKRAVIAPITFAQVPVASGSFAIDVDFGVDLSRAPAMKLRTEVGENGAGFVALGEPSNFDPKATLAGVCWDTQGNAGTNPATDFLGTTDNQPLTLRVNNARALLVDNLRNSIGGYAGNSYSAGSVGQTIGGGGDATTDCGPGSSLPCLQKTTGDFATIAGGVGNTAGNQATIGGGDTNGATAGSTIAGGILNVASGLITAIGGGLQNTASGTQATVGGGQYNGATGYAATVAGGSANCAGGDYSFAGGTGARVRVGNGVGDGNCAPSSGDSDGDEGAFVWADESAVEAFGSTGPNQFAIRARGGLRWSGTGLNSTTSPAFAHLVNTAANVCDGDSGPGTRTFLNHPLLNNNPNAVIVMTPYFGIRSGGVSPPLSVPLALYYNDINSGGCPAGRWVIYQLTPGAATPINNGARFNIWFVLP